MHFILRPLNSFSLIMASLLGFSRQHNYLESKRDDLKVDSLVSYVKTK